MLLTIAAHVRGLQGQFVEWDDTSHITQNLAIRSLSLSNLRAMFTEPVAKLYCPLTWLSFAVDYRIWGRDQTAYYCNHPRPVPSSWGNVVFFRDYETFRQAQAWCSAVLPRTHFKPMPPPGANAADKGN